MSNVLAFDTVEAPQPTTAQIRLRRLSRWLALLFTALMGLSVLSVAAFTVLGLFFSDHMSVGADGVYLFRHPAPVMAGRVLFSSQPFVTHLAGLADIVLATLPVFFICWHLRGLFRLYADGVVFARENAAHLKYIGAWLVAYPFVKFASNMIFRLAGGTDKAWFRGELVDALILGAIVFAIAQVMEFGREIEQDRAEIV
jgi:Protein of unknown function (DUF2975)